MKNIQDLIKLETIYKNAFIQNKGQKVYPFLLGLLRGLNHISNIFSSFLISIRFEMIVLVEKNQQRGHAY